MGDDVRFMLPPAPSAGAPRSGIGAAGQPWAIPAKAKHPLAAALYLDFLTDPANRHYYLDAGDIPAGPVEPAQVASAKPVLKDIFAAIGDLGKANTATPFFWAIPTVQQYWQHEGSGLLTGKVSPSDFIGKMNAALQTDVKKYNATS